MARAHFVKKAQKDNKAVKKGESYWWWKFMVGGRGGPKHYSKERPTRAQLTQSAFLSTIYSVSDDEIDKATCAEDLRGAAENVRQAGQEAQDSFDNMPEGLQQGDTGQMLDERASQCEEWADEIDRIADDLGDEPEEGKEDETDDEGQTWEERLSAARDEAASACPF